MAASITEIAHLANLSANTVSRALRGMPGVNAATSARVRQLADQLGYTPNRFAQGLVSKRSKLIALAITEPESCYQSAIIRCLRNKLGGAGYQSMVMEIEYEDAEQQSAVLAELAGLQADGIIIGSMYGILSEMPVWEPLQQLERRKIPFVVYGLGSSRKVNMVTIDYYNLIMEQVQHLISLGKSDLLLFEIVPNSERTLGYCEAMRRNNLEPRVIYVPRSDMANGFRCMNEYLNSGKALPEVFMARNDELAIGMLAALRDRDIKVPSDVWVTGFDNIEMAEYSAPRLSSAWVDPLRTAEAAFDMLMRRLADNKLPPEQLSLHGELTMRESTIQNSANQ